MAMPANIQQRVWSLNVKPPACRWPPLRVPSILFPPTRLETHPRPARMKHRATRLAVGDESFGPSMPVQARGAIRNSAPERAICAGRK
jgi:hypothetical protein